MHKSGFVNIIGLPNVGKSTLLNAFIGEKLSIINQKPQTTRHRILAMLNDADYQIVFSDTPGIIDDPHYKMQAAMNQFAFSAFEDADVLIYMADASAEAKIDPQVAEKLNNLEAPKILIINKMDISNPEAIQELLEVYNMQVAFDDAFVISAMLGEGVAGVLERIKGYLPEGPPYFPKDQFTDRSERFFVSEIIREAILRQFHQEIPYSCEVNVHHFKHRETQRQEPIVDISADIYVNRKSQKSILIGKGGSAIKKLGTESRKNIEAFLEKKVFLELHIKVREKWRDDDSSLRSFGYLN